MTHSEFLKALGTEIKVSRIRVGMSADKLAKLTGLSRPCISDIELGKCDSKILSYKRIADALGISLKDLL